MHLSRWLTKKKNTPIVMLILLVTLTVFITSGLIFLVKLGTSRK